MSNPYIPLLFMAALALALGLGGLAVSAIFSFGRKNRVKAGNYECGIDPSRQDVNHGRFPVKYYLVAMTFIIFDIEVIFLYPWAVAYADLGLQGLLTIIIFIGLITVPFIYEWRRGGLDWD